LRVVATQELERDLAAELHVLGTIHVTHATLAEQLDQLVRAEHRIDARLGIALGRRWWWSHRWRLVTPARRFDLRAILDVSARAHRERWMRKRALLRRQIHRDGLRRIGDARAGIAGVHASPGSRECMRRR